MTMLSLSRRLGITPRPDHDEYDPAAAGWLDSGRPEGAQPGPGQQPLVPQQWAGTRAVRDRGRANYTADDHATGGHGATARGPHPLGCAEPAAAPAHASGSTFTAGLGETQPIGRPAASARPNSAWPEICDQFGSHMLVLAEQLRASLNVLEAGEDDPERLKRLYQVDHAVTRMRLASCQLRTLAGRSEERLAGFTTSLLDVIRMATSAIEWYPQVSVSSVTELAVPGYAADDVATLMSALLDNATRYSPGTVIVSCHLLEDGGVMLRVEDAGIGIRRDQVTRLNAAFAGPVPNVTKSTARHTGFPVVHRIARKHSIVVRFASRRQPDSGTVAMVTIPPQLLCAIPAHDPPRPPAAAVPAPRTFEASEVPELPRREPPGPAEAASAEVVSVAAASAESASAESVPVLASVMSPQAALPQAALPEVVMAEAVLPEAATAEPDRSAYPGELPRREPASPRGGERRPFEAAAPMPLQQAAARQAFADDLSAFSQGIQDALAARGITGPITGGLVRVTSDNAAIEEGAQS